MTTKKSILTVGNPWNRLLPSDNSSWLSRVWHAKQIKLFRRSLPLCPSLFPNHIARGIPGRGYFLHSVGIRLLHEAPEISAGGETR